ncbi:MAG: hypothetical protein R3A79_22555 [Nannocystaceae bacterium]
MRRVKIDKVASALRRLDVAHISQEALVSDAVVARPGYAVACRVLEQKSVYGELENQHGRNVKLYKGDVIAGVLGERKALHGHAGVVPSKLSVGDGLHMLNLGGVIGLASSSHASVGAPLRLELLGALLAFPVFGSRAGVPAHLGMAAIPGGEPSPRVPVVFISGTCMNAGKTLAAAEIVRALVGAGLRVGAAKLTGVAASKDTMAMMDCGAAASLTFVDAGLPSTTPATAPAAARAVLAGLAAEDVDVIVAELGDGLLGEYGVLAILEDPAIAALPAVHVCCAADPVGAYGAAGVFSGRLGRSPDVFSGPVTDNAVGVLAIARLMDRPALNARRDAPALGATVLAALSQLRAPALLTQDAGAPPQPHLHA